MTEAEEVLVYDAMIAIQKHSKHIASFIRTNQEAHNAKECHEAYISGVYAPCIKLQCLLGEEAMKRGEERHAKIERECKEFFEKRKQEEKEKENNP